LEYSLIYQLPSFTILSILRTETSTPFEIFPFWSLEYLISLKEK
jgi:hypothetical protein